MLQQTQVDRVVPKYREFLRAFPTVKRLANASPAEVIRAWKGLGYNRRALYLQKTAQAVTEKYRGRFPADLDALKALPGIGDYTARAILSFAYERAVPMMDTNHRRFYQRVLFGVHKKHDDLLLQAAENILPAQRAFDWNQALMDFGSAVCLTRQPRCLSCPIRQWCRAYPKIMTHDTRNVAHDSHNKTQKKKPLAFKETDRYVRGRIIDALRERSRVTEKELYNEFSHISHERYERILAKLTTDGLIVRKSGRILLPT